MAIPTNRTLNTSKEDHRDDHNNMAAAVNQALPAAQPFTTTTMPNPAGSGDMTVAVFPADASAIAIALAGDAFPRWLLVADSINGVWLGDGTLDPYGEAGFWYSPGSGDLNINAGGVISLGQPADSWSTLTFNSSGGGVIVTSPNNTKYRIKVDNAGVLSTELA